MGTCVAGILVRRGKFLVEERLPIDTDPGYVAIPGGHLEGDESLEDALRREVREELGVGVRRMRPVSVGYHMASDGEKQRIHYFHVEKWRGAIRTREAKRLFWESKIGNLSALADRRAITRVLRLR